MKKINILLALVYIIGLVVVAYTLYQLPANLVKTQVVDWERLRQAQPVFTQLYLVVGISLMIGAATLLGIWFAQQDTNATSSAAVNTHQDRTGYELSEEDQKDTEDDSLQVEGLAELVDSAENEEEIFTKALSLVCHHLEASQAAAYRTKRTEEYSYIELFASFAYHAPEGEEVTYRFGEGLAGQVAKQGECVVIDAVPEGYLEILSGLGKASPTHLILLPIKHNDQVVGVVEIASFIEFSAQQKSSLSALFDQLALKLSNNDNVSLEEATS